MAQMRASSPSSPTTPSLYRANASVDELTSALEGFSRAQTPELPTALACCGRHYVSECEHLQAWLAVKTKLESRLILSAQVGQALLQKYEAYVRRHETTCKITGSSTPTQADNELTSEEDSPSLTHEDELIRRNATLEKSLAQALVNSEVTDSSNNTLLQELQEARSTVTRLSALHARSLGWETRLKNALSEREDMQQERDSLVTQARVADQRMNVLKDKCSKLQTEVRRLQRDIHNQQRHRLELSEEILQEARTHLQTLHSVPSERTIRDDPEMTKVLESLVADNEDLKRSNLEFQSLLQESRDDVRNLQSEVEEIRAAPPPSNPDRPYLRHRYTNSTQSSILSDMSGINIHQPFMSPQSARFEQFATSTAKRRPLSMAPLARHGPETALVTPESSSRPLSPLDSGFSAESTKYSSFGMQPPVEEEEEGSEFRSKAKKPLLLLNRSIGVQTDTYPAGLSPLPQYMDRLSPGERSESSSLTDASQTHSFTTLLERATALLTRMHQADPLTLSNRLKRQHLTGAEVVAHLSRTTVGSIISEAAALRSHYRAVLEDEKATLTAGRKELRALFKLLKDAFSEMGAMRLTLNEVVLDPSVAVRVREAAMNPSQAGERGRPGASAAAGAGGGWMAPISKLFGGSSATPESEQQGPGRRGPGQTLRAPPKIVPKQRPALAASTTTVNVEFSGAGVGRAVTNTWKEDAAKRPAGEMPRSDGAPSMHSSGSAASVMGIFAGAPAPRQESDPWVVLPRNPAARRASGMGGSGNGNGNPPPTREGSEAVTLGRAAALRAHANAQAHSHKMSRNVDAMLDGSGPGAGMDDAPPLLQRTLRRRGASDSSMHSTFSSHVVDAMADPASPPRSPVRPRAIPGPPGRQRAPPPDSAGYFGAFGKRVASFRFGTPAMTPSMPERGERSERSDRADRPADLNGLNGLRDGTSTPTPKSTPGAATDGIASFLPILPTLTNWAASAALSAEPDLDYEGGYSRPVRVTPEDRIRSGGWMGDNPREM